MAKGSPAGILMIGAGAFLLAMGFTGRFAAVWDAITGATGASADDGTTGGASTGDAVDIPGVEGETPGTSGTTKTRPNDSPSCKQGQLRVAVNGVEKCYNPGNVQNAKGGECPKGTDKGVHAGKQVCVSSAGSTGGGKDAKCKGPRTLPKNQLGVQVDNPDHCCTGEIVLRRKERAKSGHQYLCTMSAAEAKKATGTGIWTASGQVGGGDAVSYSSVQLPTGFMSERYAPNGRL